MLIEIMTKMSTGIIDAECDDKDEKSLMARLNAHKGDWMIFSEIRNHVKAPVIVNIGNGTLIRKKR